MAETNNLNDESLVDTLERLEKRIQERFPDSGLLRVCGQMVATGKRTAQRVRASTRPNLPLRLILAVIVLALLGAMGMVANALAPSVMQVLSANGVAGEAGRPPAGDLAQALESVVNLFILGALALWFLGSLEQRFKREAALAHLHELRSFAHVIDMHQLTKDPVSILNPALRTKSSPVRTMSEFQLARYLDYCTEMLSLTGKLAALYAERTSDPQIITTANDIETLTTNLGRKVFQKITMIGRPSPSTEPPATDGAAEPARS